MPKQTVEEAAQKFADEINPFFGLYEEGVHDGRKVGFHEAIKWKSEQGIDWIALKDSLPMTKHGYVIDVLATNGFKWDKVTFFTDQREFRKWLTKLDWEPTHFAYINLPEKD